MGQSFQKAMIQVGFRANDDDLLSSEKSHLLSRISSDSSLLFEADGKEEEEEEEEEDEGGGGNGGGVAEKVESELVSSSRHCHPPATHVRDNTKAKVQLIVTSILCFLFMIAEITGGVMAHSLALQADAAHLASDLIAFLVSLFAIWASGKPATKRMSFGFHRIEVLGALFSIVMIWILTGILVFLAVQRIINEDFFIDADVMIITAGCGVAFNVIMFGTLHSDCIPDMGKLMKHGHSHGGGGGHNHGHDDREVGRWPSTDGNDLEGGGDAGKLDRTSPPLSLSPSTPERTSPDSTITEKKNINLRAAIIHVIGDLIQSVGMLVCAYVIKYRKDDSYLLADPICTFIFSILVLGSTVTIFRDVMTVLMEATPRDMDYNQLKFDLENIPGVTTAHSLHVWSLTLDKYAIAVHLAVSSRSKKAILQQASLMLQQKYQISDTTIQVEDFEEEAMSSCTRCATPTK